MQYDTMSIYNRDTNVWNVIKNCSVSWNNRIMPWNDRIMPWNDRIMPWYECFWFEIKLISTSYLDYRGCRARLVQIKTALDVSGSKHKKKKYCLLGEVSRTSFTILEDDIYTIIF